MSNTSATDYFKNLRGNNTYIMDDPLPDRQRLVLQVKIYTPAFKQALSLALHKFNLLPRLQDPTATFRILDVGCGEGLYFPVIHEFLAEQGAKARIQIVGLDRDAQAVATAWDYSQALNLSNVEVYAHDLSQPLDKLSYLDLSNPAKHFDLVIASVVLMHLTNVQTVLGEIYAVLKPGGAFYTKDMNWQNGYQYPSPTFTRLSQLIIEQLVKMIGTDFAPQHEQYLGQAGFQGIESFEDAYPIGGQTETGRRMLENLVLAQHSTRPMIIQMGLMSAKDYDAALQTEFGEITPALEGHITLRNTVSYRPT